MKNSTRNLKVTHTNTFFLDIFVSDFHHVFSIAGRQRRGARGVSEKDVTPPLLAKVQGNLEVSKLLSLSLPCLTACSAGYTHIKIQVLRWLPTV